MKDYEKIILQKIKKHAEQAILFKGDINYEKFSNDEKTIAACVFSLSQIGELASRLDSEFVKRTPHISWHKIKGMRNKIVHDYEGIHLNIVWDVLEENLPELIEKIDDLLRGQS